MNIKSAILDNQSVAINVPVEMLETGSEIQVAEINIVKGNRTARFWVEVKTTGSGSPKVIVIANHGEPAAQREKSVLGTYLDLDARRAEKGLPPEPQLT